MCYIVQSNIVCVYVYSVPTHVRILKGMQIYWPHEGHMHMSQCIKKLNKRLKKKSSKSTHFKCFVFPIIVNWAEVDICIASLKVMDVFTVTPKRNHIHGEGILQYDFLDCASYRWDLHEIDSEFENNFS